MLKTRHTMIQMDYACATSTRYQNAVGQLVCGNAGQNLLQQAGCVFVPCAIPDNSTNLNPETQHHRLHDKSKIVFQR